MTVFLACLMVLVSLGVLAQVWLTVSWLFLHWRELETVEVVFTLGLTSLTLYVWGLL